MQEPEVIEDGIKHPADVASDDGETASCAAGGEQPTGDTGAEKEVPTTRRTGSHRSQEILQEILQGR